MLRTAFKNVLAHKLRLALTALAIVLGVAFVSGTYVFTDTISARFESLFGEVFAGVDATVRTTTENGDFDQAVLDTVASVDGVEVAEGSVAGFAQIIDAAGEPVGGQGPPTLGFSWSETPALSPISIGDGRAPIAAGEVVIDAGTAKAEGLFPGDEVEIQTMAGTATFEVVGLANVGSEDNLAGATMAVFEVSEAQRLFDLEGRYSTIDVLATEGVAAEDLVTALDGALPDELEAVTGEQQTGEQLDDLNEELGFLSTALLAFAGVAVFVGAFIIQNTFRIIVGQRVRELALFRAIGASRRQVTTMVTLEAALVAVVASAIGVFAGIGVAMGVKAGLGAIGIDIPDGPLTIAPRTIIVGMTVGVVVTMVSSLLPARRAAKVPPVAAMRSEALETNDAGPIRRRAWAGLALAAVGGVGVAVAMLGDVDQAMLLVAGGALAVFLGVSLLAPVLAGPTAKVLGSPIRGVVGLLARENTTRNPRRTAATASALMIGVALVAFVSVFASSIKASVGETLDQSFPADLSFQSSNFSVGLPDAALAELEGVAEIETISAVRFGTAEMDGTEVGVAGVDPATIGEVYSPEATIELPTLADAILVRSSTLVDWGGAVGDTIEMTLPEGVETFEIAGTFEEASLGSVLMSTERFNAGFGETESELAFAKLADSVSIEDGFAATETALSGFATVDIYTKADQIAEAESMVDQMVNLFTGLLGLAMLIAVLGIANTLALSVVERTREIGLLRAVGMNRRQVRSMIRWEAVMIAVFGATLGVVVGTGLGASMVATLADDGLGSIAIPGVQLAVWVVAGGLAGVVAAFFPARSAARLDVLKAISYE